MPPFHEKIAFGFVLAWVVLHVVFGLVAPVPAMWGFDILAYCRWWHAAVFACVGLGSLALIHPRAMRLAEGILASLGRRLSSTGVRLSPVKLHVVLFAAALLALFLLRTKYSGGDSHWLSQTMPVFLKRAPLSSALLVVGAALGMALGFSYVASLQAAITVVGALCVCGLFWLFALVFGDRRRAGLFLAACLASYGISRLLPGYIEIYGAYLLFLVVFECALMRFCLTGKGHAWVLGALFVLLLAHVQAAVVVPGAFVVGAAAYWRRRRIGRFLAAWGVLGVLLLAVYPYLRHGGQSFSFLPELARTVLLGRADPNFWSVGGGRTFYAPLRVLCSAAHWVQVGNVHALVSAAGLVLLASGLALWWRNREWDPLLVASAVNYAFFCVGTVLFYNFHHPIARDWDIFGPGALLAILLAASIWRTLPYERLRRVVLIVLPVTACITLLWLAQQAGTGGIAPPPEARVGFVSPP